jgi:hypothetical protein
MRVCVLERDRNIDIDKESYIRMIAEKENRERFKDRQRERQKQG